MERKYHIGTSGWSYKDWKGLFYPEKLKPTEYIKFYSQHFDITEINTSFYHLPRVQTVVNWANAITERFKFCPKISRYISHYKKLQEVEEPLARFFDVFDHIHDCLGPVLIQLPYFVPFNKENVEKFYNLLQDKYRAYEFVMEVRHDSWIVDESLELMKKYNIGFVISQSGGRIPNYEEITAKNVYVRFHGPKELYASSYSLEMLEDYSHKFKKWIEDGHIIWAFFNNDYGGRALNDARVLMDTMSGKNKKAA